MKTKNIKGKLATILSAGAIVMASAMFTACNNHPNQVGADQVKTPDNGSAGTDNSSNGSNANTDVSGTGSNNGSNNGNSGNGGTNSAPTGPTGKDNGNDTLRRR